MARNRWIIGTFLSLPVILATAFSVLGWGATERDSRLVGQWRSTGGKWTWEFQLNADGTGHYQRVGPYSPHELWWYPGKSVLHGKRRVGVDGTRPFSFSVSFSQNDRVLTLDREFMINSGPLFQKL